MPAYLRELSPPALAQFGRAAVGRWSAWAAASGLCFFASWRVAAVLDAAEPTATVWPPSGVLLAALLAARPQLSALWLGALLGSLLGSGSLQLAFLGATGSLAGAAVAERLLGPWSWRRLHSAQGTMIFALACLAGGALGAGVVWAGHALAAGGGAWRAGLTAVGSQAVSMLIVAPALVLWSYHRRLDLGLGRDAEALAVLGAGVALPALVFHLGPQELRSIPSTLTLPPLLWAAVRFGLREAATLNLVLSLTALASASSGMPLNAGGSWQAAALLHAYLFVSATTALILAAAVWETKDQMKASNALAVSLGAAQERVRMAVKATKLGIWEYDLGTGLVSWNEECYELFGLPRGSPAPYDMGLSLIEAEDRERVDRAVQAALDPAGGGFYEAEFRLRRQDGAQRWIAAKGRTNFETKDGRRSAARLAGTVLDVTDEKLAEERLEEQVRRRTAELRRANTELEEFSYSVSHELRAPLRKIAVISELIVREDGAALPPSALDRISRVRAAARRGNRIILDLLKLMRVTRLPLRRSEVDLSALARQLARPGVELVVQPGLVARADPALARELMAQLLDNACKFARASASPRVEVGKTARPEGELFFVRDNGQGFDMEFSRKIFGTFERLHAGPDDDGTGVGLAIVQRAVARHGGRVFAEGKLGRGASFYFTLEGGASA